MIENIVSEIKAVGNFERVETISRFFKTGIGDKFLGVYLPDLRKIAKNYKNLSFANLELLLKNEFHEIRLFAVIILVAQYEKASDEVQKSIFEFYISNLKYLNNWDFIDISAHKIVGKELLKTQKFDLLFELAKSENLFERRTAIISTFALLKIDKFDVSLEIAKIFLYDKEDLIHKATGWVLREIAKKDKNLILNFIKRNYSQIPRTALRYMIEKFPETERKNILKAVFKNN